MAEDTQWLIRMNTARARREQRFSARVTWLGDRLLQGLQLTMQQRVRVAAQLLRDKIVINLAQPVRKYKVGGRTVVDPASRSKPGEFPRADTTRLMKDIFYEMRSAGAIITAIVGTSLMYGVRLELEMDRSFLRRTLYEFEPTIRMILTQGVSGAEFGMSS
jgi:hypothetical protein